MRVSIDRKIKELISEDDMALGCKKSKSWNGYEVYVPIYEGIPKVGLPYVILVKEEEVRWSTPAESMEYLQFSAS